MPAFETSGPRPVAPRRSCPRSRPSGCRWTGERDPAGELVVASGARISEMSLDQRAQAEALVQLAGQQQPGVGGHRRAMKLDAKLAIEPQSNYARLRATHWVVPPAPARSP